MKIYHTSPGLINKIEAYPSFGFFNDCLFFSDSPYFMSADPGDAKVYSMIASDDKFIDVCDLHDDEIIKEIALYLSIDEEAAESILDGSSSVWDLDIDDEDKAEKDWSIQAYRGACAKKMGYLGCSDVDEQGQVYIIPMLGLESMLELTA